MEAQNQQRLKYVQEPTIGMINIVGKISTPIDLDALYEDFVPDDTIIGIKLKEKEKGIILVNKKNKKKVKKATFYNQATIYVKYNNREFKIKLFNSGNVHIPGCKLINDGNILLIMIADKIADYDNCCVVGNIEPVLIPSKYMTTMQYRIELDKNINKSKLYEIILKKYKMFALYNPETYPGIKIKYVPPNDTKQITIIIQSSGIIAMKGGISMEKNMIAHDWINNIIINELENI